MVPREFRLIRGRGGCRGVGCCFDDNGSRARGCEAVIVGGDVVDGVGTLSRPTVPSIRTESKTLSNNLLSNCEGAYYEKHQYDKHRHWYNVALKNVHAATQEDDQRGQHQIFDVFLHDESRLYLEFSR